jgi:uncharacterized repeat protein (TIGR03803 family)
MELQGAAQVSVERRAWPNGNLIMDKKGHLYGTAQLGGANGGGLVYEITP